jgi:hypothetical protein
VNSPRVMNCSYWGSDICCFGDWKFDCKESGKGFDLVWKLQMKILFETFFVLEAPEPLASCILVP